MDRMLRRSLVLAILSVTCVLTSGVEAAMTLDVGPSGHTYTTIQAAINAAAGGDTVLVYDGTYVENINFLGLAITVKSVNGAASTIINGNGIGHGVTFNQREGSDSVLDGFTILNGYGNGASWGGGIRCYSSSPTITNCIIRGNTGYAGGGICCDNSSSPVITNCTISGNTAFLGGGIFCKTNSSPTIANCIISGNTGTAHSGAIGCDSGCNPIIINCIITGNTAGAGGGIYSYLSSPTIVNCTISGNTATTSGGGAIRCQQGDATVKNSILWGNVPTEIYREAGDSITVAYSDVNQAEYAGINGNILQDPLFVDPANGDFRLQETSPCIDAGTSDGAPSKDMEGNRRFDLLSIPNTGGGTYPYYDMGALEYVDSGWDVIDPPPANSWWYRGVHFTSATEGWAVGAYGGNGVLLHYSGGAWTSVTPPAPVGVSGHWELRTVHFTSATNGWAVGGDYENYIGVLLHYSGGAWTSVTPPPVSGTCYLMGVHFTSATNGWAVGWSRYEGTNYRGVLFHYSWGKWTSVAPPDIGPSWDLRAVHFTSATEGWAVGSDWSDMANRKGVLLHYSGGKWTSVTPPAPVGVSGAWQLSGVHFTSATEGWAVGWDHQNGIGVLLHYSGGTWTSVTPPAISPNSDLSGVHFTSAAEGWVVGTDNTDYPNQKAVLLHYSRGAWTSVPPPVSGNWTLMGVHFTSTHEGWAVGQEGNNTGLLLKYYLTEDISPPGTPVGPSTGVIGKSYTYSTGGAISNYGDQVRYLFDWGDGSSSGWLSVGQTKASKSWGKEGSYNIQVWARCANHTSIPISWSEPFGVTIYSPPSPPTNVSASDGAYVDKVQVTWAAPPSPGPISYYTVYRATSTSNWVQKNALGTTADTFFNDTTAAPGKIYYYWVKATYAYGTSGFSVFNTGSRSDGKPGAPTNVSASDGTYTDKVEVKWDASVSPGGPISYYTVYRATSTSNYVQKTALGTTADTFFNDTTAAPSKMYYYWVKATNTYGTSGFSAFNTGSRSDGRPPAPTNVSASDGTYPDKVQITWTASPWATSYTVYRATSTYSWVAKTNLGTTAETFFNDTMATPNKIYYYWVKASNDYGTSGFSAYDKGNR